MEIFHIVIIGIVSCVVMDVWQKLLKLLYSIDPSNWSVVGRWFVLVFSEKQIYNPTIDQVAPIILVLGSNSLATFAVVISSALVASFSFSIVLKPILNFKNLHDRVSDIMGADIYSLFVDRDRILKNYLCGIINEFYPG